jgi:outer membrane immunogenic protein
MKTWLMGGVVAAAVAVGAPAFAADMPVKALPPPVPGISWSGIYVGGHIGGGWAKQNSTTDFNCAVGVLCDGTSSNPSGWVGGGQFGARWQINHIVLGIEGTASVSDLNATSGQTCTTGVGTCIGIPNGFDVRYKTTIDQLATATLQAGWAWDTWLWYFKGGWASAHITRQANDVLGPAAAATFVSSLGTRAEGYTVGTGVEYALGPAVSIGLEYDYYHLNGGAGSTTAISGTSVPAFLNVVGPISANIHTVLFRLNWRWAGLFWN